MVKLCRAGRDSKAVRRRSARGQSRQLQEVTHGALPYCGSEQRQRFSVGLLHWEPLCAFSPIAFAWSCNTGSKAAVDLEFKMTLH